MRRRYVDGPAGQIHLRELPGGDAGRPLLICLHPAPSSGLYFSTLMPLLAAAGRGVAAPDYPGYGGSDPPPAPATIADYAAAAGAVADALSPEAPVDLMGFHSGCLVAVEAALAQPARVRRLVLIDAPYFEAPARPALRERMGAPKALSWELAETLDEVWAFNVANRRDDLPLARAYALFAEQARAGEAMNAAFHAAFSYPCEEKFAALSAPCTIIATRSGLLEPTRKAAAALSRARLVERLDVERAVMEIGAEAMASEIGAALDGQ